MPELPEVETIKQELNQLIVNKKIKSVEINLAKQVKCLPARFLKLVPGTKVKEVRRRAKVLIVSLNNGYYLVFHLKMTGQLIYNGKVGKYTRVIFELTKGRLIFNDLRLFGWIKVVTNKQLTDHFAKLPPDVVDKEFTLKYLRKI